ncbi:phytanoyl-CoA dioxygenase family protein [Collimonas arenae]|uniref:Phytanoyl-CoA dioxygenase family protein n=1 Tax=Collimonas arenae TaxID=279058 RepID=A0A127QLC1_9BURK|nr:phytanoyl-CoA dioxygenase family protein [Collimonas arenae]AMP00903.1 phytanoyl-CoA dioxygenase family protein [Collimonas arenae]AMP10796.1 phytanoyl-CoA dioxygenase family protein [Collimonas arenae]
MKLSIIDFERQIAETGFVIFDQVVAPDLVKRLRADIPRKQDICRHWQRKNGLESGMDGAAHHIVGGADGLDEYLSHFYLDVYIRAYFDGEYILNSYGALNNMPRSENAYRHGQNFHRDVRTYSRDFRLMLNMLVMVDDFTVENGATKLLPGSHLKKERPEEEHLFANAVRAIGKAGSILLFDSNLWHSAAPNFTSLPRMALTLTFTRPFFKQQMDYPRMLGETFPVNEKMRQLLGYNARVPSSYDEWYQPPEKRMYKPGQG